VPEMLDAVSKPPGGTLVNELPITLSGYPGRAIVYLLDKGSIHAEHRAYLVGHRLYQLEAIMPAESVDVALVNRFMQSFRLGDGQLLPGGMP
jgi:hypothetical protein